MPSPVEKRKNVPSDLRWMTLGSWAQQDPEQAPGSE